MSLTAEERTEALCRQRGIYMGHEGPITAALRAHADAALEAAMKAVCINCKRGVAAEPAKNAPEGRWVHFVNDGLQPRGAVGRYVGCTAAAIRALCED